MALDKYNSNKTEESLKELQETKRRVNKKIRQTKSKYVNKQLKSIEENFRNYNTHGFYRTFSNQIKGYSPQNLCLRKADGRLALNNRENCQELAEYFKTLLNCPQPKERFEKKKKTEENTREPPPTQEEIEIHIKKLKNNRTSGEDGIVAELLKKLGPKTLQKLTQIIQEIWTTEKIPEEWKTALIHPLHKKGDKSDINNYRGISLLSVTYKILSACLLKRTQNQLEHKISDLQAGFRPNRGCTEQIFNIKTIQRMRAIRNKPTIYTFVDFKKAYDSIDRESLFDILEEYGLDEKTRSLIKETLTGTLSKVKFMGEISEPFEIKTGVRQGDGLSPLLFNITLDKIMREWEEKLKKENNWKPISLGKGNKKIHVPYLAFADDLVIIAETEEEIKTQIETLKETSEKVGLQISFIKTEYMNTNKTGNKEIRTKYGKINRVKQFKYLGEILEPTGTEKITQEHRIQKMKKGLGLVHNLYNKKCIGLKVKIRHYNTVIKPTVLYACETTAMNRKKEMEEIKKVERKILRKILGPRKTEEGYRLQKNERVQQLSNIEEDMRKRRAAFYGHISRLNPQRITKKILESVMDKKTTTQWVIQTRKDLGKMGITPEDAQERNTCRMKIREWKLTSEEKERRPGRAWSEEEKRKMGERMKIVWENRRKNKKIA